MGSTEHLLAPAGSHLPPNAHLFLEQSPPTHPVTCFRLCSGLWGPSVHPWEGCEGGLEATLQSLTRPCLLAVQEPRAGGPEVWGAQSILHDGARGGSS